MPLRPDQIRIVNYYEEWYFATSDVNNKQPDARVMSEALGLSSSAIYTHLRSDAVIEALSKRGITLPGAINGLTVEQLAVANVLLDYTDKRTQAAKLKSLGIGSQRYQGWLNQPEFQQYIRGRSEALLGAVTHEAHAALLSNVQRGDVQSLKLYYEMTGRWSSKTSGEFNIQFILNKVIESIQTHVKDPIAIEAIAHDIFGLLPGSNGMAAPVGVAGVNGGVIPMEPKELVTGSVEK